jgi:CBS domain-containing protein
MRLSDVLHSKAARVVSLPPNASVAEAASLMKREGVGAVENGRVIGVVSIGDVMKSRLSEKIQENAVLQDLARFRAPL